MARSVQLFLLVAFSASLVQGADLCTYPVSSSGTCISEPTTSIKWVIDFNTEDAILDFSLQQQSDPKIDYVTFKYSLEGYSLEQTKNGFVLTTNTTGGASSLHGLVAMLACFAFVLLQQRRSAIFVFLMFVAVSIPLAHLASANVSVTVYIPQSLESLDILFTKAAFVNVTIAEELQDFVFFASCDDCVHLVTCIDHCEVCDSSTTCTGCEEGYYLNSTKQCTECLCNDPTTFVNCTAREATENTCVDCNVELDHCYECTEANCTSCEDGYYINSNEQCTPCSCSDPTTFVNCSAGEATENTCGDCSVEFDNCYECSITACISCLEGYYLNSTNQCAPCVCLDFTTFAFCPEGEATENTCISCDAEYDNNCYECTADECISCKEDFYFNPLSADCSPCTCAPGTSLPNCTAGEGTEATQCAPCSDFYGAKCNQCNDTTCTDCDPGSYANLVSSDGSCDACFTKYGPSCTVSCDASTCTGCAAGFYQNLISADGTCDACYTKYSQYCTGTCDDTTCIDCADGYYPDLVAPMDGACDACTSKYGSRCTGACDDTTCIDCQAGTYPNLLTTTTDGTCDSCAAKYPGCTGSCDASTCFSSG